MTKLVAITCDGPDFYDGLLSSWDKGYAITPIDTRLSEQAKQTQIKRLGPDLIFDGTSNTPSNYSGKKHKVSLDAGDALVIETSGSTGQPKQVVHTHDSIRASAEATSSALKVTSDDHWLACLPLNHIGGLSVVFRSILNGTALSISDSASPAVISGAAQHGATLVSLVARVLNRIDAKQFRKILIGGGVIPATLAPNVIATYGLTETGSGIYYKDSLINGAELKIDAGEVLVKGPMLLRGYRTNQEIESPLNSQGWFRTGDIGSFENNNLEIQGRKGYAIRTGGEDVWPETLEHALETHPQIEKAAVTSEPSSEWGESVVAYISMSGVASTQISNQEIKDLVTETLPKWYVPKKLVFTDQIPLTSSGKVDRAKLGSIND